jgi:diguanylate cyclase (GGDEF)-like protein
LLILFKISSKTSLVDLFLNAIHRLISALEWLTKPAGSLPESLRRRAHLLAWLLLSIFLLILATLVLVLVVDPPSSPRRFEYTGLILGLMGPVALAYAFNHTGHYYLSAGLLVAGAVFGPWGSMLLDPTILHGDFVPLTYVSLSILLTSILLPPLITVVLAALQWAGLMLVPLLSPATASINWPSLLAFVFFTSVLSILTNVISQRDLEQIERQTDQLAISEAQLREQSIRDHLTNLFNRRYLQETLEREVQRAARKQVPLGLIMLDLDNFKEFNDTLSHAAGDGLLQELGKLLQGHIRQADIACRYGGDEFVLILPEASLEVTQKRAEQLLEKARQIRVEIAYQILAPVTISVGVAVFPDHGSTGEDILKSADIALYRAKRAGRNCVVVAEIPLD